MRPGAAMGEILDRGSLLFASITVLAVSLLANAGPAFRAPFSFYTPLLVLAVVYVPGVLLLSNLLSGLGSVRTVFGRDYAPLLTCTAMAWSAANLPVVLAAWTAPTQVFLMLAGVAALFFAVLMFFAVRTVFSAEVGAALGIVCLSWVPLAAAVLVWGPLTMLFHLLASPFFLFYALYYLSSEVRNLGGGLRSAQNYRRMLEAATVNPHDGEAQYQLGLIHQQRHQYTEAIRRFQAAVAIDPTETDAHFQLGRIARDQGRFDEALTHLRIVLKQDERHSLNEIHRELGATLLAQGQLEDARRELELYVDRREYDPEGLYWYGLTLERLGNPTAAREMYQRAVEAARTAPRYRRHIVARWSRLAQRQSRKLPATARPV